MHVRRDGLTAKFWLDSLALANSGGMRSSEIRRIERVVEANRDSFLREWNAYFNN